MMVGREEPNGVGKYKLLDSITKSLSYEQDELAQFNKRNDLALI